MATANLEAPPQGGVQLVFGAGRSGLAAARLLRRQGESALLVDENAPEGLDERLGWLNREGIRYYFGSWDASLLDGVERVILSPGISLQHPLPAMARRRGLPVIGELELGAAMASPPIFAITGTNGKTTTTSLIAHILTHCGFDAPACGNIGHAFCDALLDRTEPTTDKTLYVAEVSSYQLETIDTFHPAAAWLLNITPDHLERHGGMLGYQEAKFRIARNQTPADALALNADDDLVMALKPFAQSTVWEFSRSRPVERGAYVADGRVMMAPPGKGAEPFALMPVAEIPLRGRHNLENVLAASLTLFFRDLEPARVAEAIRSFPGVEHRIEFVAKLRGVPYYNDSKATNYEAMAVALESFAEPLVLIAGGLEDASSVPESLPQILKERVARAILIGDAAPRLMRSWGEIIPCERASSMDEAVAMAADRARPGDAVLLSPGRKSFDMFKNFEHRGQVFKTAVRALVQDKPKDAGD
jgi:UDP-N-acetylmuramoylalanine--D-glutamate ligase